MTKAAKRPSSKVSKAKAKKILKHGRVRGKPLTRAQKGMFGAAAGRKSSG